MRLIIYPAKKCWTTARRIKDMFVNDIKTLLVGKDNIRYKHKHTDIILNWGNSSFPIWHGKSASYINIPSRNKHAVNKLKTFRVLKENGISHPEWTTDQTEAAKWKGTIVCRETLTGFGGAGIVLADANTLKPALLYVKYIKKLHEYRVHVYNDKIIDVAQKKKKTGIKQDHQIRNYKNGWVYCRENIVIDEQLKQLALDTIKALQLTFGAVDIIYNKLQNKYYVLEVNTAPGLVGTTLQNYYDAINLTT